MRKIEPLVRSLSVVFMAAFALSIIGCVAVQDSRMAPVAVYPEVDVVVPLPPLEVDVNLSVEAPPPLQFEAAPDVVVIPSGEVSVYMVPNMTGVYFYNGLWYRNYEGYWFQSSIYNGIWAPIGVSFVPQVIVVIPPEYPLYLSRDYQRIRYNDFNRSWRDWDRSRHWNNYDWYKRESRADVRRERFNQIRAEREKRRPEGLRKPGGDIRSPKAPVPQQPGMKQPDTRQPGMQQPGMKQPDTRQPGMKQPGTQQPGIRQPGMKQPGTQQPGPRQPGMQQPGPRQPGMQQPGPRQPGMQQPGPRQPGMQQPGPRQPVAKPPVTKPVPRLKPEERDDKK